MAYLLGIDIGTSGTKTILIDETGAVVARSTAEYPLYTPRPQWSEQSPADWWEATCTTVREVLAESGVAPADIRGVGLSGQMHGAVFLDGDNEVLRRAILWNDQRTQAECDWIMDTVGRDRVVELISNPVLTGFTAGKIVWLRNHEPDVYARVRRVLLPKDYIRLQLTGEYATEVSDASGTALFNVRKRAWADEMLDACGIPRDWMPRAYESPEVSGRISAWAVTPLVIASENESTCISSERPPMRPVNMQPMMMTLPISSSLAVPPIDRPTVPSAEMTSKRASAPDICWVN